MDHVEIEKLLAMKKFKKNKFLDTLIIYSFGFMMFILFCSSPLWFPYIYSSMKVFLFEYLPNMRQFIFNPKCLFIVCNVIVVFLIGESKFVGSKSTSPATEIYDEYVKRSASLRNHRNTPTIVENKKEDLYTEEEIVKNVIMSEELGEVVEREEMEEKIEKEEEEMEEEVVVEEEEEIGLPAEELNQKVEDFIAKVNNQRRLEARLLVSTSECGEGEKFFP